MPECICVQECQVRIGKRAKYFNRGDIWEFKKCPPYFRVVGERIPVTKDEKIDFDQIEVEELRLLDFDPDELREYMGKKYPDVKLHHNLGVDKMVDKYIWARETKVAPRIIDNTGRDREQAAKMMSDEEDIEALFSDGAEDSDPDSLESLLGNEE